MDSDLQELARAVERDADRLAGSPPGTTVLRELVFEEVSRSCALAGVAMTVTEVRALLERDVVASTRTLADNIAVADYGNAAAFARTASPGRRRMLVATDEIARVHALAVRRAADPAPGRWRETTAHALPSGMVPPPAWLVPREVAAFVDRFARGPADGTPRILWVADAHARLLRIHPFERANGRVTRLVTNMLLRRIGLPPFIVRRRDEARYVAALRRSDAGDPRPLARSMATSLRESFAMLLGGIEADDPLAPLARFADGAERARLYKAAQRGTLQTVRSDAALLTRRSWIDVYRTARHPCAARERRRDGDDSGNA